MRKNHVHNIVVHNEENTDFQTLSDKVNEFHVEVIERRLNQMNITLDKKISIIDKIITNLKSREINGIIK